MAIIQPVSSSTNNYSDKALILASREARQYDMVPGQWNEMRITMFAGLVDSTTLVPRTSGVTESESANKDYIWFGLKEAGTAFPGDANFVGLRIDPSVTDAGTYHQFNGDRMAIGTTPTFTSSSAMGQTMYIGGAYDIDVTSVPGPGFRLSIRYVIGNRGQSNQNITIYPEHDNAAWRNYRVPQDAGKYTSQQIQDELSTTFWSATGGRFYTTQWNSGGEALPIPSSLFIYSPFSSVRLAIHAVGVKVID